MAPSADVEGGTLPPVDTATAEKSVENRFKDRGEGSAVKDTPKENGKSNTRDTPQKKGISEEVSKGDKLSGKELKERAKAEKAARRAKEKGQQGQPITDLATNKQGDQKIRRPSNSGAAPSPLKGQHKRSGSTSVNTQKLPLHVAQSQAVHVVEEPKRENKNVALFDHLYGPPRRTTVAGAGKDVHPAVLALGLQMRHYIICGSSARCVATLLAFKRVGVFFRFPMI